jgi:hypothetical protein
VTRLLRLDALRLCAACRADSVYPESRSRRVERSWWRATRIRWRLRLRCGACGARREVVVGERLMERFEKRLERTRAAIANALAASDHLRMAAQIEVFVLALELDLIDARDFGVPARPARRRSLPPR